MRNLLTLLLTAFLTSFIFAQKSSIGLFAGPLFYQGDLVPTLVTTKGTSIGVGLSYNYQIGKKMAFGASLLAGQLKGADSYFSGRENRNYSFTSDIVSGSAHLEWDILGKARFDENGLLNKFWTPYLALGIGFTNANPTALNLPSGSPDLDYTPSPAVTMPLSIGIKGHLTNRLSLALSLTHFTVDSDYLDGISRAANPELRDAMNLVGVSAFYYLGLPKIEPINDGM